MLGFARFRLGDAPPSDLVELVRQPRTAQAAIDAARGALRAARPEGGGVRRFRRPHPRPPDAAYYNAALRRLDEGLATRDDIDTTLKLGLGYPEGPIELLERTGLAHHYDVTQALFEAYGDPAYAPARRARVAKQRREDDRRRHGAR